MKPQLRKAKPVRDEKGAVEDAKEERPSVEPSEADSEEGKAALNKN